MAIDTSFLSQLNRPTVALQDPNEAFAKSLSIQNMLDQQKMNAEKLKTEKLANQQGQQNIDEDALFRSAYGEAARTGGGLDKVKQLVAGKVSGKRMADLDKEIIDSQKSLQGLASDKLDFHRKQNEIVASAGAALLKQAPEQQAASWPQERMRLIQQGAATAQDLPEEYPGAEWVQLHVDHAAHADTLFTQEMKRREDARAQSGEGRAEALAVPQLATAQNAAAKGALDIAGEQVQQDAARLSQVLKSQGPGAMGAAISQLPPERQAPFKTLTGKATPEDVAAIGMKPVEQVAASREAAAAANTEKQRGVTNSNEAARINLERTKSARDEKIFQATYGEGANPALQAVAPNMRAAATAKAAKINEEYGTAIHAADTMQSFIDMARSGNKAAGSNLPLVGVETVNALNNIKRINKTEIDTYSGAGSLLDGIKGKIGKLVSGQPIPQGLMDDIEKMHRTLREDATKAYEKKLADHNATYRSDFKSVATAPVKAFPSNQVHAYATAHGLDDAAAKKAIEASGYTVK